MLHQELIQACYLRGGILSNNFEKAWGIAKQTPEQSAFEMQIFEKYGHNIVTQPFYELGQYLTLYYLFDEHHIATWNQSKNSGFIFDDDTVSSIIESNNDGVLE